MRPSHIAAAFGAGLRGSRKHARRASKLALQSQFTFRQGTIKGIVRQDSASSSKRDTKSCPKSFLETVIVDVRREAQDPSAGGAAGRAQLCLPLLVFKEHGGAPRGPVPAHLAHLRRVRNLRDAGTLGLVGHEQRLAR